MAVPEKLIMTPAEYRRRSCTVRLNAVDVRAYIPKPGKRPSASSVRIDPVAQGLALEVMHKYNEQCINADGSLNREGFAQAAQDHLRSGQQRERGTVARIKNHLKGR